MGTAGGFVSATPRGHWMEYGGPTNWLELPKEGQVHSWTSCQLGNGAFLKDRPCNLLLAAFDRAESLLLARPKDCVQGDTWVDMPIVAKGDPKPKYSITDVWVVPNKWAESRFGAPGRVVVRKR